MLEMEIKSNIVCSRESALAIVVNTFNVNRNTTALRNRTRGEWGVSEGTPVNILTHLSFSVSSPLFFFFLVNFSPALYYLTSGMEYVVLNNRNRNFARFQFKPISTHLGYKPIYFVNRNGFSVESPNFRLYVSVLFPVIVRVSFEFLVGVK